MAEQIPYGDILNIIGSLASPAWQEFGRIYGVMDELENLKRTLESIKVVLSDAEQRQDQDATIGHWIRRLKEVLYDADNLLDDLEIKDLRRKVNGDVMSKVRDFFSAENSCAFRSKLSRKIEKIRKQFSDVAEDISKLRLSSSLVILEQNESAWRESGSFVLQSDIIGREENKSEIIDLLMQTNTNQNVSLIAIVGIGGLGKTALAQLVYNDSQVQKLFDKQMWVCVSEDFEVKTVLKKMLKSLKNDEVGDLEVDILQKKLQEELNGQRYLLVLDDVWNESQLKWNVIKTHLMHGSQGSKVLVTTRSTMVSKTMGINTPYVLKGLTKEQSWTLLKNLTFGEGTSRMSPNLESIGEKIAEKCCGVPLAIRTIGGFLHTINEGGDQWLSILNDDVWSLCEEKESMMPVLKLSYQNLPLELRQCFAYCCLYPKDWEIKKDELIQSWMAQGYLASSIETQFMEEVGNKYVKILLMRSFFQDVSLSEYNDIISFKMHDLMHDLAKSVAGNDCYLHSEGKRIIGRPMHLSFPSSTVCSLDSSDVSKLRTLICCSTEAGFFTTPSIITNLKYLRVLNLSSSSITKLPESIDKCKHLRSLNLSRCKDLISLPKSIGNLVGLQSLNLRSCYKLVFCTKIITKLISLRHLEIENCKAFKDMPVGLGKLTSLQSLSSFKVGDDEKMNCGKLNELKELNNITGHLTIHNLNSVKDVGSESQEANLKAKEYIQILHLDWGGYSQNSDISLQLLDNLCPHQNLRGLKVFSYPGVRFSSWLPSLTNIVHIDLYRFPNCQYLPPLERLPWLKSVRISNFDELEYIHYEEISHVFFPSLEKLILDNCKKLRGWKRLANDIDNHHLLPPFPVLSTLHIFSCPNLTCIPTYPHVVELILISRRMSSMIETFLVQLQSSSFNPFSGLKHLEFNGIDIEAMPEEWMKSLTSLEHLSIWGLPIIAPLFQQLQHLPAELRVLKIFSVDKLDVWKGEDDTSTQCRVPHGLRSLQKICIAYSDNLNALPERICDLQSLTEIQIDECRNLESLPEGICHLTNLQTLRGRLVGKANW